MAVLGDKLLTPESGWRRYDNTNGLIKYNGAWTHVSVTEAYNGTSSFNPAYSTTGEMQFLFMGTSVRIISPNHPTIRTNKTSVFIDDVEFEMRCNYVNDYAILSFEKINLEKKLHKVVIKNFQLNTGTTSSYSPFGLDAIDIDADGELIRYDYFDNLPYDEPTRKYGVAWFGFDEASGNVYDKLGGPYVGTVTSATRVSGWNDEGSAINFDGNFGEHQVYFNSQLVNMDKWTIRFKVSSHGKGSGCLLTTLSSGLTQRGFSAWMVGTNLEISFSNPPNSYNICSFPLKVNEWNDVILSVNKERIRTYVNEEIEFDFKNTVGIVPNLHAQNFLLGRFISNGHAFDGQVDDFQVYSKALTPADFTQQRVAIKSSDNKILTLPSREGRVKELPTADEVDLINQGYTWREIDNAVDATGFDLTQPTTEYEVVSKTNTALGAGKLFTTPLPADFKTITIEDNY